MNDYPGLYERLQKDEMGYRKGKHSHLILNKLIANRSHRFQSKLERCI